ncbi:E3 ubiquitin protein ligase RIE1 [Oryza sativa Japonica Group]|nr:E3 ubiquitin protein ligase RIE1 [Oryza sativa Japonica Group]KAF2946844.1 hypothetical protein DAI22_02g324800 [Oryza sativa Japonica Group]
MEAAAASSPSPEQPLLRPSAARAGSGSGNLSSSPPPPAARPSRLAALIGRAAGRRGPSMLVRETAAMQLERRRADWAHSRPVVALDIAWNVAFAAAAAAVLVASTEESPVTPLRLWLVGYALQCLVHVGLVCSDSRRRPAHARSSDVESADGDAAGAGTDSSDSDDDDDEGREQRSSFAKRCESINTMVSFLWWIIGFYWVVSGGDVLEQDAPRLYWLSVVFLAFDVFFAVFCVAMACFIGIALCCCLPCVIAILYALAGQEGASDADIGFLPRYRYSDPSEDGQKGTDEGVMIPVLNNSGTSTSERILLHEDAECCICLSSYEDGAELSALPCNHHFHWTCITKWLRMHATCPLCKYNILKGSESA